MAVEWKSQGAFGGGGLTSGDFNAQGTCDGGNNPAGYDVNGNHGKMAAIGDGLNADIWRSVAVERTTVVTEIHECNNNNNNNINSNNNNNKGGGHHQRVASSAAPATSAGLLPAAVTSSFELSSVESTLSWRSSDVGQALGAGAAPSRVPFSSVVSSLATVHWPPGTAAVPISICEAPAAPLYNQHRPAAPAGVDLHRLVGRTRHVPNGTVSSSTAAAVVVPTPTRRLSAHDLNLLQSQPARRQEAPAENINPEDFIQRLPSTGGPQSPGAGRPRSPPPPDGRPCRPGEYSRPSQRRPSYLEMVARALMSSHDLCLPLAKIYSYVEENYPHLKTVAIKSWKNSVRHTLSSQSCFTKAPNTPRSLHTWRLHPAFVVDFRADHFHSGLIKKRAKELHRLEVGAAAASSHASLLVARQHGRSRDGGGRRDSLISGCHM